MFIYVYYYYCPSRRLLVPQTGVPDDVGHPGHPAAPPEADHVRPTRLQHGHLQPRVPDAHHHAPARLCPADRSQPGSCSSPATGTPHPASTPGQGGGTTYTGSDIVFLMAMVQLSEEPHRLYVKPPFLTCCPYLTPTLTKPHSTIIYVCWFDFVYSFFSMTSKMLQPNFEFVNIKINCTKN